MTNPDAVSISEPILSIVPGEIADDALDIEQLGSRIVGLAGRLSAATCRWLLLIAWFDARDGYARFGLATTARWLAHYCGLSRRTAIEHVRVARALAAHPPLAEAMSAGRLSFSHVRAISRAVADPDVDARLVTELIDAAEHATVGQLESLVRGLRTVQRNEAGVTPEPYLNQGWTPDSYWRISARLHPEDGALVQAALKTIAEREHLTREQALVRIAEIALAVSAEDKPAPRLRGDEHAAVVIHLDATQHPGQQRDAAGTTDDTEPGRSAEHPTGRIDNGPGLPDAVVRRLLCAGRVRTALHQFEPHTGRRPGHRGSLLDLGRSHRIVSRRLFRALELRDHGCCTYPGCESRAGLEAHHVAHWIDGGPTNLENLVLLCRAHHHAHHDGAFSIHALDDGSFRFLRRDSAEIPAHVDPTDHMPTTTPVETSHPDVTATAATTRWDGTRMDRDWAVSCLAQRLPDPSAA